MRTISFASACLFLTGFGDRVLNDRDHKQDVVHEAQLHAQNEVDTPRSSAKSLAALFLTLQNPEVGWQAVGQSYKADARRARSNIVAPRPALLPDCSEMYSRRTCAKLAALALASSVGLTAANAGVTYDIGYIVARKADPNYRGPTPSTEGEDFLQEDRDEIQRLASLTKRVLFSMPTVSDGGKEFQRECDKCNAAKSALDEVGAKYGLIEYDLYYYQDTCYVNAIMELTGATELPCLFVKGKYVAGGDEIATLKKAKALKRIL